MSEFSRLWKHKNNSAYKGGGWGEAGGGQTQTSKCWKFDMSHEEHRENAQQLQNNKTDD